MLYPGANMSTQVPKLEKLACESQLVLAPTLIAAGALPGEFVQASVAPFPAAVTTVIPALVARCTASFNAWSYGLPRLMLITAGLIAFAVTQSIPATTPPFGPLPTPSRTRTAWSVTPFAAPTVAPPTVPATCVPCQ